MAKKKNHHLYQDKNSGVWYFQKKVKTIKQPYKISLETTSVTEARRKRDEYLKQIEIHGHLPGQEVTDITENPLFGEVAVKWAGIIKPNIEESSFENYRKVMNTHILPRFGNKLIDQITGLDIETFISQLNCSSKTKLNVLTPFKGVMKFAKKHKIIQSNPFLDVAQIKKTKSSPKRPLDLQEIGLFLDALDDYWKPLFIFLFFTGVRIAEASGLKWKRVDLARKIVQIQRNVIFVKGKAIYKKPKTQSSVRDIQLPQIVIDALREQRKRTWKGDGENFVFQNKLGRYIHRHTLNRVVVKPILEKIGITDRVSIKDTRASYITNALDHNERMSFIQKQVGHTTTRMIVDHYYRYVPANDDGSKLEEAWNSTRILPESDESDS